MSKKESYWAKHKQKLRDTGEGLPQIKHTLPISDEMKAVFEEGQVLLIDKPLHWTSFDVVRKIRNAIRIKKVGHAGTLDPLATGLLIVCTGKFTKKINEIMADEKEYTGTFTVGAVTPTYDLESEPTDLKPFDGITAEEIKKATHFFLGDIMQLPPIYSAIKKEGEVLYKLARRGEAVELTARPVQIREFEITNIDLPVVSFKVVCSTGTYIRSLAHDMGQHLGCGAYLSSLRRTRIGKYPVQQAQSIDHFLQSLAPGT